MGIDLMVLPTAEGPPRFLWKAGGFWRDAGSAVQLGPLAALRQGINQRLNQLMQFLETNEAPPGWLPYKESKVELYEPLVPAEIRQVLERAALHANPADPPVLRIYLDPSLDWIPWEIMYDGTSYLGIRFQLARLPLVRSGPEWSNGQPREVRRIYNILGEHVLELPALFDSWQATFKPALEPAAAQDREQRVPADNVGEWPNQDDIAEASDGDILHVTCHGLYDLEQQSGHWSLNHKKASIPWFQIGVQQVEMLNLSQSRPLVFGNACSSASLGVEAAVGLLAGFGPSFFKRGALAFVGTFAPIRKALAVEFAQRFYNNLLVQGLPVGRALWATKKQYLEDQTTDPSWLFYCLYGPPETQFQLASE